MAKGNQTTTDARKGIDPFAAFCFGVKITGVCDDGASTFFRSVSGLRSESDPVPYKEGGVNTVTHMLVGPTKWANLVLKKGFSEEVYNLVKWRESFLDDNPGRKLERRDGEIIQYNASMEPVCSWTFKRGWPVKWEGPDYDANKSDLAIETIEIAHQGLVFNGGGGRGPHLLDGGSGGGGGGLGRLGSA